ncbi:MAG: isoprenylcysteine carboxylmethyltransferase family protein [Candidatus Micrarchaeia archaeon]|jgi:protein-S-isoprenylcysteine O-methyltransferase Ste14
MDICLKALLMFFAALAVVGAMLFVPAGTLEYWQAWAYMAVVFVPVVFVGIYFLAKDPAFIERRFKMREKEKEQQLLVKLGGVIFAIGFLLPGLDRRFGWSSVPFELVLAADAIVLLGYALVFLVFKENSYAGRTIRVEKGQKVVATGPYSVVRHPMYAGTLLMYLATPIALGSYVAIWPFLLMIPLLVYRIRNEEKVLKKGLKGYSGYCRKVKCRLVPGVW